MKKFLYRLLISALIEAPASAKSSLEKSGDIVHLLLPAAIGIISGLYFTEPYAGITISPTAESGHYGLNVSGTF